MTTHGASQYRLALFQATDDHSEKTPDDQADNEKKEDIHTKQYTTENQRAYENVSLGVCVSPRQFSSNQKDLASAKSFEH
jgi:hypothetical protein